MDRAKGFLWTSLAYALAGVVGSVLGALAASAALWLGILVGAVAAALVLFGFGAAQRSTRFLDLFFPLAPFVIAVTVFRFAPHEGSPPVRRALVLATLAIWCGRIVALWILRFRGTADEPSIHASLRSRFGPAFWGVSLGALHVGPAIVVFLVSLSFVATFSTGRSGLNIIDIAASALALSGLAIEAIADHQLARFLRAQRVATRVCDEGLFAILRHPRHLGEILFWWGMALFGIAAHSTAWWTILGPLALTLVLVLYAAPRRDQRESERRPDYASYMRRVPAFLPRVLR